MDEPRLRVQGERCATCIFSKPVQWDLPRLLDQIRDPRMSGHFRGHRVCHHSRDAVCAGFWAAYRDHFDLGQLAQRLGWVEVVQDNLNPFDDGADNEEEENHT